MRKQDFVTVKKSFALQSLLYIISPFICLCLFVMKKFPLFQSILVVLLIGIIVLGFFMNKKKSEPVPISATKTDSFIPDSTASLYEIEQKKLQEKMDLYALYNNAVDTLDINACEKITGNDKLKSECSDNVYSAKASKEKDVALCGKIQDTSTKAQCTNSFTYNAAISGWKQSDCDKIIGDSELKSACVENVVFAKIESQSFSGTTDTCQTLTGADKDYCVNRISKDSDIDLLQKGTNTEDINICAQIKDVTIRNTCNDTVYMAISLEKKDASFCVKIIDTARKTNCTTQFARVNDASILSKAITESNISLCATIVTPDLKTKCSDNILLKTWVANKDSATCAKIDNVGIRKQCNDAVTLILEQQNKNK